MITAYRDGITRTWISGGGKILSYDNLATQDDIDTMVGVDATDEFPTSDIPPEAWILGWEWWAEQILAPRGWVVCADPPRVD